MKRPVKLLSLFLALVMLAASVSVAATAADATQYLPTIIVPGIFQSETKLYDANGNVAVNSKGEEYTKPFYTEASSDMIKAALTEALLPVAKMVATQEDKDRAAAKAIAKVVGEQLYGNVLCDKNGHFIKNIKATKYSGSYAELSTHDQEYIMDEFPLQNYVKLAGGKNLYVFSYASLGNMVDTANELYEYIQFVKKHSGSAKVNIVPISQGGSLFDSLMQIYTDKGRSLSEDVHRVICIVPAIDGSILVGEIFQNGLLDSNIELYSKMFPSLMGEENWTSYLTELLIRIMPNAVLNDILDETVFELVNNYMKYSTLLWGLVPSGNYDACRTKYLMDEDSAVIRTQTDWFHTAQTNAKANIKKAIADGVQVYDLVDYNVTLYELCDSYDKVNADGIIQLDSESLGAYSLGVNVQLPENYVSATNNCTDATHNHKDPHNIVDPCTGLLPETTFYFYNQNHEQTASNDVIMKLTTALLTRENFTSVFSYPNEFPQFNTARISKGFMKDLDAMRTYDTSALPADVVTELKASIAESDAVLANTVVDTEKFEAAKTRFYNVRATVLNGGTAPAAEKKGFDFNSILLSIFKEIANLLFDTYGGMGFSDILKQLNFGG